MKAAWPWLLAAAALLLALALAAQIGKTAIPIPEQFAMLFGAKRTWPESHEAVFLSIRLPRVILAALVGAALAVSGAGFQGLFRNPLADPYLLGVASGAGLGATAALFGFGAFLAWAPQPAAFLGALVAVAVVQGAGKAGTGHSTSRLILAGVAVSALANSLTSYLIQSHADQAAPVYSWLLGGFNVADWGQVAWALPFVLVGLLGIVFSARPLNLLQLGEETARSLGVDAKRTRRIVVLSATMATAAAVSVSGLIGFVGLIVPHGVRLAIGPDFRRLLPASALCGAIFLPLADALCRLAPGQGELPVGVMTAACGAPFFLVLIWRSARSED